MSDWQQIGGIAVIVLLMMFVAASIIDNPDVHEARRQFMAWAYVLVLLIGQAIW